MRISGTSEPELELTSNTTAAFECPWECRQCCALPRLHRLRRTAFKCISPEEDAFDFDTVFGHNCSGPEDRLSSVGYRKFTCMYTPEQRAARAFMSLDLCAASLSSTDVESFQDWIGNDTCHVSVFGKWKSRRTEDGNRGGLLGAPVGAVLRNPANLVKLIVTLRAPKIKLANTTRMEARRSLRSMLNADMQSGRVDRFALAAWGFALKKRSVFTGMPKVKGSASVLPKFRIGGWPTRMVSYKTPPGDINKLNPRNIFRCIQHTLRDLPVEDGAEGNSWSSASEGAGLAYRTPVDVFHHYFEKWGLYPDPYHFMVPSDQLQTDAVLSKFVFQSIGAHRVELVEADGTLVLNPMSLGGCEMTPTPRGCPASSRSVLEALPTHIRSSTKYLVRMEGLFEDVPVRDGFAHWGGNAFFDSKQQLVALQYKGETVIDPTLSSWSYLKFVFRSSLVSTITSFDHLVGSHIMISQALALATFEAMPSTHSMRLFFAPHTAGALKVNFNAALNLFPKQGLVHRASPFAEEAFEGANNEAGILWAKTPALRFIPFSEVYERQSQWRVRSGLQGIQNEIPMFEDAKLLHDAFQVYTEHFIAAVYGSTHCDERLAEDIVMQRWLRHFFNSADISTPDFWPSSWSGTNESCAMLKEMLADLCFHVTGFHHHVGTVMDFFRDTRFVSTSWRHGEYSAPPKQTLLMILLAATTNKDFPRLGNSNLSKSIFANHPDLNEVYQDFWFMLERIEQSMESRNELREKHGRLAFTQMSPKYVEWSVAV